MSYLSFDERLAIMDLLKKKWSIKEIAEYLERDYTTIMREIKRNSSKTGKYNAVLSYKKTKERLKKRKNATKYSQRLKEMIDEKLSLTWSPQQISTYMKDRVIGLEAVSTKTIYRWIEKRMVGCGRFESLRRKGKKGRKRVSGTVRWHKGKTILERPIEVESRQRKGDWEIDTVVSPKNKGGCLVTALERKSRFLKARILKYGRKAEDVAQAIIDMLKDEVCHTITVDNGREFSEYRTIEKKLGAKVYFAEPYKSWQRGSNENVNGLLRYFFPKGTEFYYVSQEAVERAVNLINNRPLISQQGCYTRLERYVM